jgi:alanine dehydrogenase
VQKTDVVVGAVLIPGAKAPKLITKDMLSSMKNGSVLVDVVIDQGGCFETSKATTHGGPIYVIDGVIHYCAANMPGAVAKTSTLALKSPKAMPIIFYRRRRRRKTGWATPKECTYGCWDHAH